MNIPQQHELSFDSKRLIRLQLLPEQVEGLAPLVTHGSESKNTLFFAVTVPFSCPSGVTWEFQVVEIPAKIGHKILKLIGESKQ